MRLFSRLRPATKNKLVRYEMGAAVTVLGGLIVGIFSLSVADHYLLQSNSLAAVISAALVDLTNEDRTGNALGGLTVSPVLIAAAQAKADDMAAKSYFAHISPDGKNSWYWFKQAGYAFTYAGENLAVDFSDSVDVERAWMNSPTHRANILNGHFTQVGIATAQGVYEGRPTTFVVQMFAAPATAGTAPSPVHSEAVPSEPTTPAFATTEKPAPQLAKEPAVVGSSSVSTAVLGAEVSPQANGLQHIVASPKTSLRYVYCALAGLVFVLLALVTRFEFRKRHLRHLGVAMLLLVLMFGLAVIGEVAFFSPPIVATL